MEIVSYELDIEGETHTIKVILEFPERESERTLVNLEFLNGICVLFLSVKAVIHCLKNKYI